MPLRTVIAPQLSQLGASAWKLANCSLRTRTRPPKSISVRSKSRADDPLPFVCPWPLPFPLPLTCGLGTTWPLNLSAELTAAGLLPGLSSCLGFGRPCPRGLPAARPGGGPGLADGILPGGAGRLSRRHVGVGLSITGQEGDAQPAEDVIHDALGDADIGVLGMPHRLEARVRELVHVHFQRHAVLQAHRHGRAEAIHQAADGAPLFGHRDEHLARPAIVVQADGDVAFVPGDAELVGDRLARVGQALAARGGLLLFGRRDLPRCWSTAAGFPSTRRDRRPKPSAPAATLRDKHRRCRPAWCRAACSPSC